MKISYSDIVKIIYLSFALDSLLKLDFGFQIHIGVLLILVVNGYNILLKNKWNGVLNFHKLDIFLVLFSVYLIINGLVLNGLPSLYHFFYFFIALNVYKFCSDNMELFTQKTLINFQWLMIITGIFQILVVYIFDHQINFLPYDHYNKGGSVPFRLRGFFLEPNWFAIAFTFNSFLLIKNDFELFFKKHKSLMIFTILVMLLNGSFATLGIIIGIYGYKYAMKRPVISIGIFLMASIVVFFMIKVRIEGSRDRKAGIRIFNHYSRFEPTIRTHEYLQNSSWDKRWFGYGFGNWGTIAVREQISVLVFKEDPKSRDGSEMPVFYFELGYIGVLIFLLDFVLLFFLIKKQDIYLRGAMLLFLVSLVFYPIFKFWMYMPYYFIVRNKIIKKKKVFELNLNDGKNKF